FEASGGEALRYGRSGIGQAVEGGKELEILFGGELVVKQSGVGDDAQAAAGIGTGQIPGGAAKRDGALGGTSEERGEAEERGFSGTVGAEQGDEFAGRDFQGGGAEGADGAVAFFDVGEGNAEARRGAGGRSGCGDWWRSMQKVSRGRNRGWLPQRGCVRARTPAR